MASKHEYPPTEAQCVRIRVIDAFDSLGYRGVGREEHSGERSPVDPPDLESELADNQRSQLVSVKRRAHARPVT